VVGSGDDREPLNDRHQCVPIEVRNETRRHRGQSSARRDREMQDGSYSATPRRTAALAHITAWRSGIRLLAVVPYARQQTPRPAVLGEHPFPRALTLETEAVD
jgi:hypothetical protein